MSGGSFEYLYSKDVTDPGYLSELEHMIQSMKSDGYKEEALLLQSHYDDLEWAIQVAEMRHEKLSNLMHAYEWWQSGDYGEDSFKKAIDKHKGGIK